jgi:putative iron-only hydrogenase system regulator
VFYALLLPAPSGAGIFYNKQNRMRGLLMDTRIALIGIVLSSTDSVEKLNHLLSEYGQYIVGRMGIPYREKNISIISIAMDAPSDIISALSGKLGMLPGVNTKTIYSKTE